MAGYQDTREAIIDTLMGRAYGHEIQPDEHQNFALMLLDYIHSIELISGSALIGVADVDTVPVQPDNAHVCYVVGVPPEQVQEYLYFIGQDGVPISVSTGEMEAKFVILLWNTEYWSKTEVETAININAERLNHANFYYNLSIRKTYSSVEEMVADKREPIGVDGRLIKVGETVTVCNEEDESENAVYSYTGTGIGWEYQTSLVNISSRTIDGGRADTRYGGTRVIDCGGARG